MPVIRVEETESEHIFQGIVHRTPLHIETVGIPDLLVVSPETARRHIPVTGRAKILLLPGFTDRCDVTAECAVTYGMSARDTLTLSSFAGHTRIMALQREVMTISGCILERQEVTVHDTLPPEILLAVYGALVILGEPV